MIERSSSRLGRLPVIALAVALASGSWIAGCDRPEPSSSEAPSSDAPSASSAGTGPGEPSTADVAPDGVPEIDLTDMEDKVAKRLRETREAVLADPSSAEAWGRFGRVAHAHELWGQAAIAYRRAQQLDLDEARWPYFLGDVLSVVGTDLKAAERAFRRSLELNPDYAPAHMRLGKVLVADNCPQAAAKELRRALELVPDLQPARVTLAQLELADGDLDSAESMLEEVLSKEPRHAQALSTLGQVYMRQGRRDEARDIAERARDAAIYNLYSDPLMGEVVNEGVSSVLIWERAKAFLDNGEFEQAAIGLQQVVEALPDNPDAHYQLAIAYRGTGRMDGAGHHLEKVVALDGDRVDPRVQLADLLIENQRPQEAISHLEKVLELAPDDPEAPWLLGRAKVQTGDLRAGIAHFENAETAGLAVPVWVHNDWGSALARTGRPHMALDHFRIALAAEPENPQSLFYAGLVLEGTGRTDEAVDHYCRSMKAQPNPLAGGRLQALGRSCP